MLIALRGAMQKPNIEVPRYMDWVEGGPARHRFSPVAHTCSQPLQVAQTRLDRLAQPEYLVPSALMDSDNCGPAGEQPLPSAMENGRQERTELPSGR